MTKATTCLMNGAVTGIEAALQLRDGAKARRQAVPVFHCTECGGQVDPHNNGVGSPAHFEHRTRNRHCSLSVPASGRSSGKPAWQSSWITTAELAHRTAGGDDYIRTKDGAVKGLALRLDLNEQAPEIVVVGKGPRIEARARLFVESGLSVPTYVKRATNAWELIGQYQALAYRTDLQAIQAHAGTRPVQGVAGILFLARTDEVTVKVRGGGFADPETRREVELAAIRFVQAQFEAQGYTVHDHQRDNLGYDLMAVKRDATLRLEVKGTDASVPRFFLTRNEHKCAINEPATWRLVIVTSARVCPSSYILTGEEMRRSYHFDPLAWECTPRT